MAAAKYIQLACLLACLFTLFKTPKQHLHSFLAKRSGWCFVDIPPDEVDDDPSKVLCCLRQRNLRPRPRRSARGNESGSSTEMLPLLMSRFDRGLRCCLVLQTAVVVVVVAVDPPRASRRKASH